jgi:TP901 family phage tail tape measure protein
MSLQSIGLGGVLNFAVGNSLAIMAKVKAGFGELDAKAQAFGKGMGNISQGLRSGVLAAAPLALGVGAAFKQASSFEAQMAVVRSISDATGEEFKEMEKLAKHLGATTSKTGTEAAQGLELIQRAGFTAKESMAALPGVLAASAAEGIDLADTADIISNVLRSMNIDASEAGRVADVLAVGSAKSNASIKSLGESFKYAAPTAQQLGLSLEDTTAALGILANAGIKGSLAGTSFTNMFVQLSKPTKEATKLLKDWGVQLEEGGKLRPLSAIIGEVSKGLQKLPGPMAKARALAEVFGLRGQKAVNALALSLSQPEANLENLIKDLANAKGAAEKMASERLNSFEGALTRLRSAAEGLFLELFGPLLKPMTESFLQVQNAISGIVVSLQKLNSGQGDLGKEIDTYGQTVVDIALGIHDAIQDMKRAWASFDAFMEKGSKRLAEMFGKTGTRDLVRFATLFTVVAAAATPILIVLAGIGFVIQSVLIPLATGLWGTFSSLGLPVIAAVTAGIAILAVLWAAYGQDVMSFWEGLKSTAEPIFNALAEGWATISEYAMLAFDRIVLMLQEGSGTTKQWTDAGRGLGMTIAGIIPILANIIGAAIDFTGLLIMGVITIGSVIKAFFWTPIKMVRDSIGQLIDAFFELGDGNVLGALKKIGLAIVDTILLPLQMIIATVVSLADNLGASDMVPDFLRTYGEGGVTALLRPEAGPIPELDKTNPNHFKTMVTKGKEAEKTVNVKVDNKTETTTNVNLDGKKLASSVSNHQTEIQERTGFKASPWQRRVAVEHGAHAVLAAGGG